VIFMKSLNRNNNIDSDQSDQSESDHTDLIKMNSSKRKRANNVLVRSVSSPIKQGYVSSGIGKASFVHALIVIFLEFFCLGSSDRPSNHSSE